MLCASGIFNLMFLFLQTIGFAMNIIRQMKCGLTATCLLMMTLTNVYASNSCNGFEIKIKNNLSRDIWVKHVELSDATLDPSGLMKVSSGSSVTLTVNQASAHRLKGNILLRKDILSKSSTDLDIGEISLDFLLKDKLLHCDFSDKTEQGETTFSTNRSRGAITYNIG